jgi:hypothetical protein
MIRCALVQNLLTAAVLAGEDPGWPIRSHADQCIKCQAHAASLRATRRRLSELGHEQITPPVGFEIQVMDGLESAFPPASANFRWARAAGASMAAALLAAVWMRRRALSRA